MSVVENNNTNINLNNGNENTFTEHYQRNYDTIASEADDDESTEEREGFMERFYQFRKKLWILLEEPSSSWPAAIVSLFITFLIVFSVVTLCVETLPRFYGKHTSVWLSLELVSVIAFTIEYILRLFAASHSKRNFIAFIKSPFHFVDLSGFVPFYIHVILLAILDEHSFDTKQFAVFRVMRLLRILRLSRFSVRLKSFFKALGRSVEQLVLIFVFMLLAVLFFSTSVYYAERGDWNASKGYFENDGVKSSFQSIPEAFWWCIVTMTTTGYGDVVPITILGRFVAMCTMGCGILIIAIPSMIVGRNLSEIKDERIRMERLRRFNAERRQQKNRNSDRESLISGRYNTNNENNNNNNVEMVPTFRTSLDIFRQNTVNIRQSMDSHEHQTQQQQSSPPQQQPRQQQFDQPSNTENSSYSPRTSIEAPPRLSVDTLSDSNEMEALITALREQDAQITQSIDHLRQALYEVTALRASVRQTLDAIPSKIY